MSLFTLEDRERVRDRVLELAAADERVVAGAVVGSLACGAGDRWSDLDLTFAVADAVPVPDVLVDWTCSLVEEVGAVHLFDLSRGASIYRVFVLPGCLQLDLSFTPASAFGAGGPKFELLFGQAVDTDPPPPVSSRELFGTAVHHALRARFCIERGRLWQAEYWISGLRDDALALVCRRRGLPTAEGRGFDDLPPDVLESFEDALVRSLRRDELLRALRAAIDVLQREADEVRELAVQVEPQLRTLTASWGSEARQESAA